MRIRFFGATGEVTGSCFLIETGHHRVLVDCGLIQGSREHERHNKDPFPFDPAKLDAMVLTHAHLDHSGRLPLLVKRGFKGPVHTHTATAELCRILLEDAGYLNEKEAEWENRKRERKGLELIEPLYTRADARLSQEVFSTLEYGHPKQLLPGVTLTLRDAGHILGSAIAELELHEGDVRRRVVFSGDLGHRGAPILRDPEQLEHADLVVMESTYGDRLHRPWDATWKEMGEVLKSAGESAGNVLIPAFAVDRTQMLLYTFNEYFNDWRLGDWQIFLDSPMAIETTRVYAKYLPIYDEAAKAFARSNGALFELPNLRLSQRSEDSMKINRIRSGAIIIAGSGMCTGGRIKHHLKHNIWRRDCHVMIVGFQARGTPGRALVDGAHHIRLWGETIQVKAQIHTINGLSAHADQDGLVRWYRGFANKPPVALVHGEAEAAETLAMRLAAEIGVQASRPAFGEAIELT